MPVYMIIDIEAKDPGMEAPRTLNAKWLAKPPVAPPAMPNPSAPRIDAAAT